MTTYLSLIERYDLIGKTRQLLQSGNPTQELLDGIDSKKIQALQVADKRCRKFKTGSIMWSPDIQKARDTRRFWIMFLRKRSGKQVKTRFLQRLAKASNIVLDWTMTMKTIETELQRARTACRIAYKRD